MTDLSEINPDELQLLKSLTTHITKDRYTEKIRSHCLYNSITRLNEVLEFIEPIVFYPGNAETAVRISAVSHINFTLAYEVIDNLMSLASNIKLDHRGAIARNSCLGIGNGTDKERKDISSKRVAAFHSLTKGHKDYKPLTEEEREKVINSLLYEPIAQQKAIKFESV